MKLYNINDLYDDWFAEKLVREKFDALIEKDGEYYLSEEFCKDWGLICSNATPIDEDDVLTFLNNMKMYSDSKELDEWLDWLILCRKEELSNG